MDIKQEHSSIGDNIAGDKIEETNYYLAADSKSITSKITTLENYKNLDFSDDIVFKAFKETVVDLIKEEQQKSHNLVPIGHIRNFYKHYIDENLFQTTMKTLNSEKSVEINKIQVCYVPKDLNYNIEI